MKEKKKNSKVIGKYKNESVDNIKTAFFLNLIFAVLEMIGGFLTNSIAIISDAIHDLGDSISIGASYILEKKSKKEPDENYTYGYLRYSLLGAFITATVLLIGSIFVIFKAIARFSTLEVINYDGMIIFAIFGVLINGYAAYVTSKGDKTNEKAISLHMLEDVLGWATVLIGSICMKVFELPILDPILSIAISLYILFHVYKYLKEVFHVFMERVPSSMNVTSIEEELCKISDQIKEVHHTHIWTMDGINNYITTHVVVDNKIDPKKIIEIKKNIKERLENLNITHNTIEIDYTREKCQDKACDIDKQKKELTHKH